MKRSVSDRGLQIVADSSPLQRGRACPSHDRCQPETNAVWDACELAVSEGGLSATQKISRSSVHLTIASGDGSWIG